MGTLKCVRFKNGIAIGRRRPGRTASQAMCYADFASGGFVRRGRYHMGPPNVPEEAEGQIGARTGWY